MPDFRGPAPDGSGSEDIYPEVTLRLAQARVTSDRPLRDVLKEVTEAAAVALHVNRVSVWFFLDERRSIRCDYLHEPQRGIEYEGTILHASDLPVYFKLLESSRRWSDHVASVDFDDWLERSELAAEPTLDADLRDLLDQGLRHLSPEHRAVVELTYFYGCSYDEIALIAECPVNTVKTRMFHARAKLRKLLPALGKDPSAT